MPLLKGKKNERKNVVELSVGGVGPARHKAIGTIMKRKSMSYEKARQYQAKIIAQTLNG